jgi:hypothetical protein
MQFELVFNNIHGPMARISAFQADGSGSIPDGCIFFCHL